jgi:hypothetical protein
MRKQYICTHIIVICIVVQGLPFQGLQFSCIHDRVIKQPRNEVISCNHLVGPEDVLIPIGICKEAHRLPLTNAISQEEKPDTIGSD